MCYVKAEQTFHVTSSAATLSISSFPAQRFSAASSVFALFSGASGTGESVKKKVGCLESPSAEEQRKD
jgi:hypothetical protein